VRVRVGVMHGINFDALDLRDPDYYGGLSLNDLEFRIKRFAGEFGMETTFSQTNSEGEFCEILHRARKGADALVLNPGAWTHYSWAIRDALEIAGVPAVEVHLSAVSQREEWRRQSVIRDLCVGTIEGRGVDGYRDALELLKDTLGE
jgi:3-dehydroquinate dehydratase II